MKKWVQGLILFYLSILFFGSFYAVGLVWTGVMVKTYPLVAGNESFLYYFFAGAIGASLRHLYMFCSHFMKSELTNPKEWVMYIFYPIFATGTAVIAILLIDSGILLIEITDNIDGPYAQVSIAFFVGFGFNRFLNKLNSVSKNVFGTKKDTQ